MYCSSCGAAIGQGLSYCKNCGAKLPGAIPNSSELFSESLVWAIVSVFIVGLGSIIGLAALMKKLLDSGSDVINGVILLGFLLMIAIEAVFIWLLLRQKSVIKKATEIEQPTETAKELYEPPARVLTEAAIPSVREHTTRSFEPIYAERKSE